MGSAFRLMSTTMTQRPTRLQLIWATLLSPALLLASNFVAIADEPTVLRGHVLLPDGKPAVGAGLYWVQFKAPPPRKPEDIAFEKRAAADDEGRFELTLMGQDAPLDKQPRPLVAHLPGYGVDWLQIGQDQVPDDAVLRLVEDSPVRGRVADTEGRHIAGAKVTVAAISGSLDGNLDDFLAAWTRQWRRAVQEKLPRRFNAAPLLPLFSTVTNREGHFELSGIGTERVASVNISAPGLVSQALQVVNRKGFDAEKYNKAAQAEMPPQMRISDALPRLVGPAFDHIAETDLVVRGTVFTGPDRRPVARAIVGSSGGGMAVGGGNNSISANTDESGRFELRGLRRSQDARLFVYGPKDSNLLFRSLEIGLATGQTVVEVEVEMKQGVIVAGRVFDQATGRGVRSSVQFAPLPGNEYAEERGPVRQLAGNPTDDDGHFRMLVMPGPGVLMAQVQRSPPGFLRAGNPPGDIKPVPYRQASFSEEDSKRVLIIADAEDRSFRIAGNLPERLMSHNAVKVIDVAPGSEGATFDLPLDPGKTATIAIEDEQGEPVTDVVVAGVADCWPITIKTADPNCTIYGLGADRPRQVYILHPERHLAASVTLTGDEPGPVTVRLGAAASIIGRALDPDGEPLADAIVQIGYFRRVAFEQPGSRNTEQTQLKSDADGRFRVENILPGERLTLSFRQGDKFFGGPRITDEKRQLKSGEQLDLGEFKAKALQ